MTLWQRAGVLDCARDLALSHWPRVAQAQNSGGEHAALQTLRRVREALRQLVNPQQSHTPLPELIERLNRHLRGWANYLDWAIRANRFGRSIISCGAVWDNTCNRRSQRGWRARQGLSLYAHLEHLGLVAL